MSFLSQLLFEASNDFGWSDKGHAPKPAVATSTAAKPEALDGAPSTEVARKALAERLAGLSEDDLDIVWGRDTIWAAPVSTDAAEKD